MTETIFAPATGGVRAAVAVLRLSGPGTRQIIVEMAGALPASRRASLRTLRAACGEILDRGLVLWMPAPASYTGEDSAELHLHGGRAVVGAVTNALLTAGARPAEPGEFTRRGFLNGRMDLLEAEAVADLVAAETDGQRRQAVQQLEGAQSSLLAGRKH
jgi:tRNA modification GTPase